MLHILIHTLEDLIGIIPFLYIAFLIMEYLEHRVNTKKDKLNNKKLGPVIGSILGVIPQCGFSVLATNLFSSRVITFGTLLAVYLSTSDEMLPLLISNGISFKLIIIILSIKVVVGIIFGYLFDLILRKKENKKDNENNYCICKEDDCHCEKSLFKSSLIHTLKITFFIFITTFLLNILIHYLGEDKISMILLKNNFFGPFLSSLVGLIPNCASSVIITELYVNKVITTGMLIGGLLTGSGVGLLVLFRVNKNKKENLIMLLSLYLIGVLVGIIIDLFSFVL